MEKQIYFRWDGLVPKYDGPARAVLTLTEFSTDEGMTDDEISSAILNWINSDVYGVWLNHADFFGHENFQIHVINGDTKEIIWKGRGTTDNF
ncbi:MAG: hypothetical protein FWC79_03195 [Oscillospiraceae bacterium]|nr:hypothetical protein [Oscillospiraceae bacterium]